MGRAKGKLSKGQPRGSRSASGRKRDRAPLRIGACDGILRRRAFYGVADNDTDTVDAIGRAYVAGLLGSGEEAKNLLIAGRRLHRMYWRIIDQGYNTMDSLARYCERLPGAPISDDERVDLERETEKRLNAALAALNKDRAVRRVFDQLVIDVNPDSGPPWLDRIIYAHRTKRQADEGDYRCMRLALQGLSEIA